MRVWFLKQTNSIDTESSVGANTVVWSREVWVYRITPRRNDEVNDTWMADSGSRSLQTGDRRRPPHCGEGERVDSAIDIGVNAAAGIF